MVSSLRVVTHTTNAQEGERERETERDRDRDRDTHAHTDTTSLLFSPYLSLSHTLTHSPTLRVKQLRT